MGIFRKSTPPAAAAVDRADAAAIQAEMARYSVEDGDEGAAKHRQRKAVRAARGLRLPARDEPDSDRD
ncbi:hypothetical protein [Kitasatospora sp. MBT66]|uniref:hypothetical protein n=1 Tax=Kitasatospora TaxID=2063 RepID=UPI0005B8E54B|nr:hypothetical protein [Kitasatospora sp. MBT66]